MAATASVIWFRQGLRLHDNPALLAAIAEQEQQHSALLPIFIFDGESASTKSVGYNRMCFLLQSLHDLDEQFHEASGGSGQLYILRGQPAHLFRQLHQQIRLRRICFEQDCDPTSSSRDNAVKSLCQELSIECVEQVSHTLWDPRLVIDTNGGIPPLTYQMFLHTVQIIGLPRRPVALPDWRGVSFMKLTPGILKDLHAFSKFPTSEQLNVFPDNFGYVAKVQWRGGERQALQQLKQRLKVEENAFKSGYYLPNQTHPNVLESSKSLSAHLCFGCLSVCRFYWDVHDLFKHVQLKSYDAPGIQMSDGAHITGQLIWREYFYTMSMNNPNYDRMQGNEICLNIPWATASLDQLQRWQMGRTGYPLIDAAMRQLLAEGWLHHTLRNTVATFLTRGGLWQSWEHGLQHFLKYLLDADLAVCAGNWMWVSSSAFECMLDSSLVTCPVALAKRLDPHGQYTKQYVAELAQVPQQYIHEPWLMPSSVQQQSECIIGVHYPERMIDLAVASRRNMLAMKLLRHSLVTETAPEGPPHCRPSSEQEVRQFFWLPE